VPARPRSAYHKGCAFQPLRLVLFFWMPVLHPERVVIVGGEEQIVDLLGIETGQAEIEVSFAQFLEFKGQKLFV
jgi:hypothetical protein